MNSSNLTNLIKITQAKKKRLGQGEGSGRSKTSGRGTKGQKARGKVSIFFEGGAVPLTKRLPFLRGKGRHKVSAMKPFIVNLDQLNQLTKDSIVDIETLAKTGIVDGEKAKKYGVKILGAGKITMSLVVKLPISKSAADKIQKAGGRVEQN